MTGGCGDLARAVAFSGPDRGLGGGPAGLGRGPERLAETRGVGAAARRLRKAGAGTGQAGAGGASPVAMVRSARRGRPRAGSARANPSEVRRAWEVILAGARSRRSRMPRGCTARQRPPRKFARGMWRSW